MTWYSKKRNTFILKCFIQFICTNLDCSQKVGGDFLNFLQKEGGTQKGEGREGFLRKGGVPTLEETMSDDTDSGGGDCDDCGAIDDDYHVDTNSSDDTTCISCFKGDFLGCYNSEEKCCKNKQIVLDTSLHQVKEITLVEVFIYYHTALDP